MTGRAAMGVVLCAALATPALAAEWSATAGWGVRLDDHRVMARLPGEPPARVTPWTQVVLPALDLAGEPLGARVRLTALGRLEFGQSVAGEAGALRSGSAGEASGSVSRTFASGVRFTADGLAARSRDLLDVDQATVSANGDATRWSGSEHADSRWLEGQWHSRGWRSATTAPSDTRSFDWGARAFLDRSLRGAWFFGGHERRMDRDGASVLRAQAAALGVQREVAPGLGVTLEMGAVTERIGLEQEAPRPGMSVELGTPRDEPARATQLRVRFAHELGNEFEFELGRRAGRANAWARASSQVDIEGADAAGPAVIQRASLGAGDTLAAATVLGFEASVARDRSYRGLPLEPVTAARIGAWVERRVQPWLSCRAGWDLLHRSGSGPDAAPGFRRSRFEVQLLASSRRHP